MSKKCIAIKNIFTYRIMCDETIWLFLLVFVNFGTEALRNVSVTCPQAVKRSDMVTLRGDYDLEGRPLYTIKWYKSVHEFYRYTPKELPSVITFPVLGVNVNLSKSRPQEIILEDVQPEASGYYNFEVSTDAPDFETYTVGCYIIVVDVPEVNPVLIISKEVLGNRYILKANCTTPPSFPPMNVTWHLNSIKVNELTSKRISLNPTTKKHARNSRIPSMTVSYLEEEIDDNVLEGNNLKIQCTATLFDLYRGINVRYISDDRPKPLSSSVYLDSNSTAGALGVSLSKWTKVILLLSILIL